MNIGGRDRAGRPKTIGHLDEALAMIAEMYRPVVASQRIPTTMASGRVLSSDVFAAQSLPRVPVAAMDGFSISADSASTSQTTWLKIVGETAAGAKQDRHLKAGEAIRISTGAVLPSGSNHVVRIEDCTIDGDMVEVPPLAGRKPHVRRPGEDVETGQCVLAKGTAIGTGQMALLEALGVSHVEARSALKVAIISSGDELRPPGEPRLPWQIADVNGPFLARTMRRFGCDVLDFGIVRDEPNAVLQVLIAAARAADLILTSGGASIGTADYMSRSIRARGFLEFWQLTMRPGKPVGFGDIDDCPMIALPGNPLAAAVGCLFLARPLVSRLSGRKELEQADLALQLQAPCTKRADLDVIRAARLVRNADGSSVVDILPDRGSASVLSLAEADGLARLPRGAEILDPGSVVDFNYL